MQKIDRSNLSESDYIVIQYEIVFYAGMLVKVDGLQKDFPVKCLTKAKEKTLWKWPTNLLRKIPNMYNKKTKDLTSKGLYDVPDFLK